jgi:hypothetical protein
MQLRFVYLYWDDVFAFFECAKRIEQRVTNKRVKWFETADDAENIERMRKMYPCKMITTSGKIAHIQNDTSGYERALIDIELLARADETIITGGSTFGYFIKTLAIIFEIHTDLILLFIFYFNNL